MRLHHIALSVKNLNKSIEFYSKIFGFAVSKRFERPDLGGKAVFLELKKLKIELWEFKEQRLSKEDQSDFHILGIKHIAFQVRDFEKEYVRLKKIKNVQISEPKIGASGGKYCFLKDPNGISIEIYRLPHK